jgi:protein-tyrosine phosphatase
MAEGFFNALTRDAEIVAESAGVGALDGAPPSLLAVLEMRRRGVDISRHRARNIASVDLSDYQTAVALDRKVAALFGTAAPEFGDLRVWEIPDPYGGPAGEYRLAAGRIRMQVEEFIRNMGKPTENMASFLS